MTKNEFKQRLRQSHTSTMHSAQAIVEVLADHEPKYMAVSIGSIEGAATRLETAARQLRDLAAVSRADAQSQEKPMTEEKVRADELERIAKALEVESDVIPCREDAMVYRSCAALIRANFSYDDADRLEEQRLQEPRT